MVVIGPRLKVEVLGEGYALIPETPSFGKVSRKRFDESKATSSGSVRGTSLGRFSLFKMEETFLLGLIFHLGVVLVLVEPQGLFGWRLENHKNAFFLSHCSYEASNFGRP